ncbi:MAG: sulfotransferase [Okeania sp. SIO2D1]|nr:sulfotransferase [Okeania sp. SIO2D1]
MFLVGTPRSGTTLLQQILNAHSQIAIAPETNFMKKFWRKRRLYKNLSNDQNYQKLISDIVKKPVFAEMGLNADDFRQAALSITRDYGSLFNLLLEKFAELKKTSIVGEKTPEHLRYIEMIYKFFPSALFIHIVRDPRAVVNSWRKVPWSSGNVIDDTRVWHRNMIFIDNLPAHIKSSIMRINYEKLVLEPEQTLKKMCNFIGVEFEAQMLEFHTVNNNLVNVDREPWKVNIRQPLNPKLINQWQSELSPSMIFDIEAVAWFQMIRLRYPLNTPLFKLLPKSLKIYFSENKKNQINQQIKSLLRIK